MNFSYQARTREGDSIRGTIDAANEQAARQKLQAMGLSIEELSAAAPIPRGGRPLSSAEFQLFNQQLAHLVGAGLPVEQGLRLIGQDLGRGRVAAAIGQIAGDLERGMPLGEAFERRRGQFPVTYGRLIDAGVRASNLPGVLLNLGRHLEMMRRLREAMWRAAAYPLMVAATLLLVILLIGHFILPGFEAIFKDFKMVLPTITQLVIAFSRAVPIIAIVAIVIAIGVPILWAVGRAAGWTPWAIDYLFAPLPLVGWALRDSALARWCDTLRIGVDAGLDLPAAVELAGGAAGSPALSADSHTLAQTLRAGKAAAGAKVRRLPPSITTALDVAAERQNLPQMLLTLASLYEQRTESRLNLLPALLMPAMLLAIGLLVSMVVVALFAPMLSLVRSVSGA